MYGASIGITSQNAVDVIKQIKRGLPASSFEKLRKNLDVSEKLLSSTVRIAKRTLIRRKQEGRLKTDESERLFRIAKLYDKAIEVFEDRNIARKWFKDPVRALGGKTPLEFADTELGAQEVEALLGRIEHGIFS
ncbi:MAG: DUF2384 domain-containing protein [Deltaproteobacteria bacterium]|nr:DUF2384 domain-containing protein [Deltaproteobacteria bacterium]